MKYNAGMKAYYNDIAVAIKSMLGKQGLEEIRQLADGSSPVPLREYLKEHHGKSHHGGSCHDENSEPPFMFACSPQNFILEYDHAINNNGDEELTLTWSQVVAFIKGKKELIFDDFSTNDHSNAADCKSSYFEALKAVYPNLTIENLLDNPEYDFCPGEFFEGAKFYYNDSCNGDCERCWNQQAAFEYKPTEDVTIPEEWKAEESAFPCDNCAHDDNGCCDYPDTPDDYCVCGDKQVPVTAEDNSLAFDYSELDNDTATRLHECETVIRTETAGYFTLLGAKFKEAQELLANHSTGTFEKWYTALGFKRQTVYNLIRRFEFSSSPTIGGHEEAFEALPLTLSYEISKADAPPELVEKVLDGDITTNAEYQRLKNEMERLQKRLAEETARADRNASERIDLQEQKRKLEQENKDLDQRLDDEVKYSYELQEQIEQLQNQPVDVAVIDNSDELAEKDSEIAELKEEIERLSDKNIKNFVIKLSVEQFDVLLKLVKDCEDTAVRMAVQKAQLLRV